MVGFKALGREALPSVDCLGMVRAVPSYFTDEATESKKLASPHQLLIHSRRRCYSLALCVLMSLCSYDSPRRLCSKSQVGNCGEETDSFFISTCKCAREKSITGVVAQNQSGPLLTALRKALLRACDSSRPLQCTSLLCAQHSAEEKKSSCPSVYRGEWFSDPPAGPQICGRSSSRLRPLCPRMRNPQIGRGRCTSPFTLLLPRKWTLIDQT